jgi:diguanylate cyclase (GGDEF)-like protein
LFEKDLSDLAFRDPLTGLANRAHFYDQARFMLSCADDQKISAAIIFFDLDNFKNINDTHGHAAGDQTLKVVADRIRSCLRSNDIAARLGGDEFTILIENTRNPQQLVPLIERIETSLEAGIRLNGVDVSISGSIGLAMSIPGKDDVGSLLHRADLAMYRAKKTCKGSYVIFDPTIDG